MQFSAITRFLVSAAVVALLGAWAIWLALPPHRQADGDHERALLRSTSDTGQRVTEARLQECIGQTGEEVVGNLGLTGAKWYWTDEPPGILRGVSYYLAEGGQVTVYLAEGEPLFRRFDDRRDWDYEGFLACRVGGIQYQAGGLRLDIGPDVPEQWRQE
jgi:hypothetical protein